jgi:hypothetical protein
MRDASGSSHLGVYEKEKNKRVPTQRATSTATPRYIDWVEIVPYDDSWLGKDEL